MVIPGPLERRQRGVVLAMSLVFLALLTVTARLAPRIAALDLARSSAVDAWSRADMAARAGIVAALGAGALESTVAGAVASGAVPGAGYTVERRFLGFVPDPRTHDGSGLVQWHFLLSSTGSSTRAAEVVHVIHLVLAMPAPDNERACMDPGCDVPPVCADPPVCETTLMPVPVTVGWHLREG